MMIKKKSGFTLVELMVTVAIVGILAAIAFPSFQYLAATNSSAAGLNQLRGQIGLARSEAIRRNSAVSMCGSNNVNQADVIATPIPSCNGSSVWTNGWIVFVDTNGNGTRDAGEILLRVSDELASAATFIATTNSIIVNTRGFPATNTFVLTPGNCKGNQQLTVSLSATGNISTVNGACP